MTDGGTARDLKGGRWLCSGHRQTAAPAPVGQHPGLTDPGLPWTPLPRRGGDKGPRCKQLGWTDTSQVALRAKRVANRRARVLNLLYGGLEQASRCTKK